MLIIWIVCYSNTYALITIIILEKQMMFLEEQIILILWSYLSHQEWIMALRPLSKVDQLLLGADKAFQAVVPH